MSNKYSTLEREIAAEHSPFLRYHPVQPLFSVQVIALNRAWFYLEMPLPLGTGTS